MDGDIYNVAPWTSSLVLEPEKQIFNHFVENVANIPEVESILGSYKDIVYIYTIIKKSDEEVRRRIYEFELDLMDHFPSYDYDFHVISLNGRDINTIISTDMRVFYSKKKK